MRCSLLILLMLIAGLVNAQKPTIEAKVSSHVVTVNEIFELQIITNHDFDLNYPEIDGLIIGQASRASHTNIEEINGKASVTQYNIITHGVKATKTGDFTIGSITVRYNGKLYGSQPIKISVKEAPNENSTISKNLDKPFYADVVLNKSEAYVGEQIFVYNKLYSKVRTGGILYDKYGEITGVVDVDSFPNPGQVVKKEEKISEVNYETSTFSKILITPIEVGDIYVQPYQIQFKYVHSVDMFGFPNYQFASLSSAPRRINIKPLPANYPDDFNGGVGEFKLKTSINKDEINVGDVVQLDIEVYGSGNLQLISNPILDLDESKFEIYGDPVVEDTFNLEFDGLHGTVKYSYLLKATEPGDITLPKVHFSYFDLKSEKYIRRIADSSVVKVDGQAIAKSEQLGKVTKGIEKKMPETLAQNIDSIEDVVDTNSLWTSSVWYKAIPVPLFLGFIFGLAYRRREKNKGELETAKTIRQAGKKASQRFTEAKLKLDQGDHNGFYEEMHLSILGYLSDKFQMPISNLSKNKIAELLTDKNISITNVQQLISGIEQCEMARFASMDATGNQTFYKSMSELVNKLDEAL